MNRMIAGLASVLLAAALGCSGQSEPAQPKLTDEQIKGLMKQGSEQRERGDARPPEMGPSGTTKGK